MKIKKGTHRIVVSFDFLSISFKFPRIRIVTAFKEIFSNNFSVAWVLIKSKSRNIGIKSLLFVGIIDNWQEFIFFLKNRNVFLLPTYFSFLGLFNIVPTGTVLKRSSVLMEKICKVIGGDIYFDLHHFTQDKNFCFYKEKIRILDYGSPETQKVLLEHFDELNKI